MPITPPTTPPTIAAIGVDGTMTLELEDEDGVEGDVPDPKGDP